MPLCFSVYPHLRQDGRFPKQESVSCAWQGKQLFQHFQEEAKRLAQTVVITGGSQGMGKAVGRLLAEKGANVIIVSRNAEKLQDALRYIRVYTREHRVAQKIANLSERNMLLNPHLNASITSAPI